MGTGQTFIEINYNSAWVDQSIAGVQAWSWLYTWGMFLFLIATIAVCIWVFFDSVNKKKGQKALVPRILSIVGIFLTLPAFIFKYTGNADGVTNLVRLGGELGAPYYQGPIYWNVKWLVAGYGPFIAILALVGLIVSIVAVVIYSSTVQRAKPATEFVQAMSNLERSVEQIQAKQDQQAKDQAKANTARESVASAVKAATGVGQASSAAAAKTVFDSKPQAATVIDVPMSNATLTINGLAGNARVVRLPLQRETTLGRGPANSVQIEDMKASGSHARIFRSGESWAIADSGSTNGTFVNGARIAGPQTLNNGDAIRVGDTTIIFASGE